MEKLTPIQCEIRRAAADAGIFHLVELKTGKEKLVGYGRVFPIKGTKRFIRSVEKEYGIDIVNKRQFIKEVKDEVKASRQK